ncbi:kinase-like protein [Obba rivulosa]|uniref:Kinase-like protein n=1 Tax=Obba rivulosa TaxID=1052685 RepID=A0A8E2DSG5_9APHY|nr:kinase-like protein [Obba rivulosa]
MLIYEVFTEEPPFLTESATDIRAGKVLLKRPISRTALKNGFTDEMWGLLLDCSSSNPEHRPKFARIVSRVALMANNWTREARPMVECASHSLRLSSSAHSDTLMDNAHLQTASQSLPQEKESLDLGQSVTGASLYHSFDIPPCHLRITENAIPSRLKLHDGYPAVEFVDLKHPCGPKKGSLVSLGENGFQALTSSGKDARWEHRGAVVTMIYLQHTTHVEYRFDQATHASQWFHLFKRLAKGRSLKSRPKGLFRSAVECPDTPVQVKWYWTSWFRVVAGLIMTTGTKEFHTDPPEQSWSQWRSPVVYSIDSSLSTHTSFTYVATSQEWKGTRSINVTLDGDLVEERLARDAEILRCWEYRFHTAELAHSWFHAYKIMVVDKFQTESSPAAPGAEGPMMSLDSNRNALGITSDSSRASRYTFVGSNEPYDLGVLIPSPEMTGRTSALHANLDHAYGGVATPTGTQLSTTAKPLPRVPVVGKVPPVTLVRYHVRMRSALDSLQIYKRSLGQIVSLCGSFVQSFAEKTSATNLGADDMTTASAWYKRVCEATERYINYDVVATLIRATHMKQELHELYFARPEVLRVYGSAYFPTRLSFRPDLDETLDAYRAAVASSEDFCRLSSLQGDESQLFVEYIDKILDIIDPHDDLWKRSLHLLRNLCGTNGICPLSFIVPEQLLQKQNDRPMASGGFCDVWRGIYRGHDVALKVWRVYRKETIAPATLTNFCKEAAVCKHLRHPNIVSFYGIDTTLFPLCLVCEWMPLGTIADYLTKQPTANRLILLVDIVAGLSYLHDVDIMHGDLKGSNVLVNRERKACLADFGLASFSHDSKLTVLATRSAYVGSMRWTAPEIMDPEHFGLQRAQLDRRTDMYSLAMVMWEVFTGSIPFSNLPRDATVMNKVLSGGRPDRPYQAMGLGLTDDVWEIMQRCWEEDLSARPAACDVLIKLRKSSESAETLKIPQQWPLVM